MSGSFSGFTLVEILVVIGIVCILAALVLPVIGGMQNKAKTVKTISNLRQLQTANISYASDHDGRFLKMFDGGTFQNGWKWNQDFLDYLQIPLNTSNTARILRSGFNEPNAIIAYNCSKVPSPTGASQHFWDGGANLSLRQIDLEKPFQTIAFLDANDWWANPGAWNDWTSVKESDADQRNVSAAAAYRNNGKVAAVTYAGGVVLLDRKDLDPNTDEGGWRWYYDGKEW